DTATLFDLASLTKVVGTTTSLMLLADQGKIHVDDPVSRYLPGFDTGAKRQITLRHLLTHTAGLYEWYPLFYRSAHRDSTIRLVESLPLKYPVGRQRRYSDLGFMLLGAVVERVSGMPLEVFEARYVFGPLGMTHTTYNPLQHGHTTDIAATSLGNPYEYRMTHDSSLGFLIPGLDPMSWNGWRKYVVKGEVNDGNAWYASEGVSGHAGLFSTVGDIQRLVDMLMDGGKIAGDGGSRGSGGGRRGAGGGGSGRRSGGGRGGGGGRRGAGGGGGKVGTRQFISAATIRTFLTPDSFRNGLGWMMDPANSFMKDAPAGSFGHTGFTGTSIAVVPSEHLSVIILINRQNIGLQPNQVYYNPNPIRKGVFECAQRLGGNR